MGQASPMYQVADGINTRQICLHLLIDTNPPSVVIQTLLHQVFQTTGVSTATDCYQYILASEALLAFRGAGSHFFQLTFVSDRLDLGSSNDVDAPFAENTHQQFTYLFINRCENDGQHLNNGYL